MQQSPDAQKLKDLFADLQLSQDLAMHLIDTLKKENAALRKMDVPALTKITREKNGVLVKIHYLDQQINQALQQSFADSSAKKPQKISDILDIVPKKQAIILRQYKKNLSELRQKIQRQNLINKRLTNDTLLVINDAISLMTSQPKKNQTYGKRGLAQHTPKAPLMISREV